MPLRREESANVAEPIGPGYDAKRQGHGDHQYAVIDSKGGRSAVAMIEECLRGRGGGGGGGTHTRQRKRHKSERTAETRQCIRRQPECTA